MFLSSIAISGVHGHKSMRTLALPQSCSEEALQVWLVDRLSGSQNVKWAERHAAGGMFVTLRFSSDLWQPIGQK